MTTFLIYFNGLVQGIGFRPNVYKWAKKNQLKGSVCNAPDGVHIYINCIEHEIKNLYESLKLQLPSNTRIDTSYYKKVNYQYFDAFNIVSSHTEGRSTAKITPDFALCETCKNELHHPKNIRFGYAFTTCTTCGPRYSIIEKLPYDRENSSMKAFEMCEHCNTEYQNPIHKRFYSQTNSCAQCGVQLHFYSKDKTFDHALESCINALKKGHIVAVKGIGGYILMGDASNPNTIQKLRDRKQRPNKPFALLFKSTQEIRKYASVSNTEKTVLESKEAPIVLLQVQHALDIALHMIAPKLNKIGAMLPNSPLLELIANAFKKPLFATSANKSGGCIIYDEHDADALFNYADYILNHNRKIITPQDDSVVRICPQSNRQIIIRRSRGYAPNYWAYSLKSDKHLIAFGADMKSSIAIHHKNDCYVSQYLGDLSHFEAQENLKKCLAHFKGILNIGDFISIADAHPQYYSSHIAAESPSKPQYIPHHTAHLYALLEEHQMVQTKEKIMVVIWDGLGWGTDGNIWGGEFFLYSNKEIERVAHCAYFPIILNDKMAKEPRLSLLSMMVHKKMDVSILESKFSPQEWLLYPKLIQKGQLFTSSMGRIFDAVASLLGLIDQKSYEAEAAILLEECAQRFFDQKGFVFAIHYKVETLFEEIIFDLKKNISIAEISAKFHISLVMHVKQLATSMATETIGFSGGVFQNALLVDLLQYRLENYKLLFHKQLSPNDENISFGQIVAYQNLKN